MKFHRMKACCLAIILLFSVCPSIYAQEDAISESADPLLYQGSEEVEYAPDEIIVKYQPVAATLSEDEIDPGIQLSAARNVEVLDTLDTDETGRTQVWKVAANSIESVTNELAQLPNVEYAEPNYKINLSSLSYDEDFDVQWGLSNPDGYDINVQGVWESLYDSNENYVKDITVAVLDTGMDISHPDLREHLFINHAERSGEAGVDDDNNGLVDDVTGWDFIDNSNTLYDNKTDSRGYDEDRHGTHIAGIIAAELNGKGIQGIAYDHVNILPIKFLAGLDGGYTDDAIKGIRYAEEMGASIVNCSWGSYGKSAALEEAMKTSRMLFVCAAGNDKKSALNHSPSCYGENLDNVIAVSALDQNGDLAEFSNYASYTIAAPGVDIWSTLPGGEYGNMSGTSMAAPFVAGTAALLKISNGKLSAKDLKNSIYLGNDSAAENDGYYCKLDAYKAFTEKASSAVDKLKIPGVKQYGGTFFESKNLICSIGGYNQDGYIPDAKVYDPNTQAWSSYSLPKGEERVFASYYNASGTDYIVGGRNQTKIFDDFKNYYAPDNDYRYNYTGSYREPVSGASFVVAEDDPEFYKYYYVCGGVANGEYKDSIWWDYDYRYPSGHMLIVMPEKRGYGCAQIYKWLPLCFRWF